MDVQKQFKTDEGTFLYATGSLTSEIYGLAMNKKGKLVIPVFKRDEFDQIQAWMQEDGKPVPLYSFKFDGKKKTLRQPDMEGNVKIHYLLLKSSNGPDRKPTYYRLEAVGNKAIEMNMYFRKYDNVSVVAKLQWSTGVETGKPEPVWVIEDIVKTKSSFVAKEDLEYEEEYED